MKNKNNKIKTFSEYSREAHKTAIYPKEYEIEYLTLGLAGEAGEVANKVKKLFRDDNIDSDEILLELGDVLWYISELSRIFFSYEYELEDRTDSLENVANMNLEKLRKRKEKGTLKGSGDLR